MFHVIEVDYLMFDRLTYDLWLHLRCKLRFSDIGICVTSGTST